MKLKLSQLGLLLDQASQAKLIINIVKLILSKSESVVLKLVQTGSIKVNAESR